MGREFKSLRARQESTDFLANYCRARVRGSILGSKTAIFEPSESKKLLSLAFAGAWLGGSVLFRRYQLRWVNFHPALTKSSFIPDGRFPLPGCRDTNPDFTSCHAVRFNPMRVLAGRSVATKCSAAGTNFAVGAHPSASQPQFALGPLPERLSSPVRGHRKGSAG